MAAPVTLPLYFGLPHHGLATAGTIALPTGATKATPQPHGGGTVIVGSPSPPTDRRTPDRVLIDSLAGKQWLPYALLSGTSKMLGGKEVDPSAGNTTDNAWQTRRTGRWIYHDGTTAWLMRWDVTPTHRSSESSDEHRLAVTVVCPFGLFGDFPATWPERKILDTRFTPPEADFFDTDDLEVYLALHSQDGSKTAVNLCWSKNIGCSSYFGDFLTIYPWLRIQESGDGRWLGLIISGYSYVELTLSGKGSRDGNGAGITATTSKSFITQYDIDDDTYSELNEHFRTVSPSGDFASWYLDDVALKVKCGNVVDGAFVASTHGTEEIPREADFLVDSCYDSLSTTAPNVGVQLLDNWGLRAKQQTANWTMLHLQAGPPETNGVSYDIGNDQWTTTTGSCYV